MIEIALYQPDIAPNAATILRMCACFGLTCRIIEPAGFVMTDSAFRRAGMDYLDQAALVRDAVLGGLPAATAGPAQRAADHQGHPALLGFRLRAR